MADTKISAMSAASALDGTEAFPAVQGGDNVKATSAQIATYARTFSGALVKKASDQTTADYTTAAAVAWDTESYDVGGWHEGVTNPSRMTIPAGVSYVRLKAQVRATSVTADTWLYLDMIKNGASFDGIPSVRWEAGATDQSIQISSPVVAVVEGDYFQVRLQAEDSSITVVAASSWFAIEKVS